MLRIKTLFVLLLVGVAFTACSVYDNDQPATVVSVSSEMSVSGPTVLEMRLARSNLHRVLINEAVAIGALAPVTVQITEQELLDLAVQEEAERTVFPGPKLVGMVKPVFAAVDLAPVRLEEAPAVLPVLVEHQIVHLVSQDDPRKLGTPDEPRPGVHL